MPKLAQAQSNLTSLQNLLNGGSAKDQSLDNFTQMSRILAEGQRVLMGQFSNIQESINNNQANMKALVKALKVSRLDLENSRALQVQLSRIEKDLTNVPRKFPVAKDVVIPDASEQLSRIEKDLQGVPREFPETDLSELRDLMLSMIESSGKPTDFGPQLKSIKTAVGNRKKKWIFKVERDSEDRIQRVVVT